MWGSYPSHSPKKKHFHFIYLICKEKTPSNLQDWTFGYVHGFLPPALQVLVQCHFLRNHIIRIAAFDSNIPIRMTRIQNMDTTKCCWGCAKRALIHCWWGCKMGQPRGETIWQFLTKQNIDLSYDPAATLLGVYPDAWKRCACPKRCTHVGRAFVHHFQNLEAAKMSLCHWMDK